ncbi:lysozyme inhibitor LprI family protein [Sphingomonas sp.]|uniref:lysozyme inhibitor LprI family protein n=1 Tax=Sphingomonas sp. TaxID=28214 RepID=UPI0039183CBA
MLAFQVEIGPRECTQPSPDDMRPYSLCLAETFNNETERKLQHQLRHAVRGLRASKGAQAASQLRSNQRHWDRQRHQTCAHEAVDAPVSEQARVELTCLSNAADTRIARLTVMSRHVR